MAKIRSCRAELRERLRNLDPTMRAVGIHLLCPSSSLLSTLCTDLIHHPNHLQKLHLTGLEWSDAESHQLFVLLERSMTLKELALYSLSFTASTVRSIAVALIRNRTLEGLTLGPSTFTISLNEIQGDLASIVATPSLRTLCVSGFEVLQTPHCDLAEFCNGIKRNRQLRRFA